MDTIFALASAQGKAGVAIVRVSGPDALGTVQAMCGSIPEFRLGSLRNIADSDGTLIDRGLVLTFPKGASFTGEDVAEFHLHGSRAVIASVLRCLSNRPNHRLAEAGEFTRRALENGCLDLTEVEGLADLIDAAVLLLVFNIFFCFANLYKYELPLPRLHSFAASIDLDSVFCVRLSC